MASEKKKILIVDDEEDLCHLLKLHLEETEKYEARTESRGMNALTAAIEFQPDLIILDFMLPDLDGGAIAEQLQKNELTSKIPYFFLTGIASQQDTTSQGDVIGGQYFLAKPITADKLIKAVEENLNRG